MSDGMTADSPIEETGLRILAKLTFRTSAR